MGRNDDDTGDHSGAAESKKNVKTTMLHTHVLNRGSGEVRSLLDEICHWIRKVLYGQNWANPALMRIRLNIVGPHNTHD